ncbi:hypothetical protein ABEF95_008896 [Exophiala dermatitidis]|uniref:DUF7924 domain-containing protein n=3 Tax=Exophiala dermatitidis TaxID=5970 RepID=H6C9Y6_EXODN|nr:uncharacterized protein HMPREF1120_08741 [Exophiala dermatitidis NIH/UT8656]KAJ4524926.1 hypothetical protein HRR75_000517 [Exophiala dermatitidis]EHY60797.1 hypothetical protein HMPREF1120_08741 [Exophiala dermatitidis NIH/UT8656]KAJ4527810.1 hypothetical protein HRR74_000565 [Exophiala dermatitidis]KAJ4528446.1 hypothetical protein HRR73_001069 [Exophiala dermatitidis]KAJ4531406.1 hypothetical protein HRR76_009064 [Exophiala dermatitidis]
MPRPETARQTHSAELSHKEKDTRDIGQGTRQKPRRQSKRLNDPAEFNTSQQEANRVPPYSLVNELGRQNLECTLPAFPHPKPLKRKRETEKLQPILSLQKRQEPSPSREVVKHQNPIAYWARTYHWPDGFYGEPRMSHLFARKKSECSFGTRGISTSSDQGPREDKNASYQDPSYSWLLEAQGSYMVRSELGITKESELLCRSLFTAKQTVPRETIFSDGVFETALEKLQGKDEARVIQDIARLVVPSAETLASSGDRHLDILIESVNECWSDSIPLTKPRPQPDYSVGFRYSAFRDDQLKKLQPFVGELSDHYESFFMGTWYMYFPFFCAEVTCGAVSLDTADNQNAHSMTLAVRGIVELFRLVKREKELHREILAFSISHDHDSVRIYGHYPVIDGEKTRFYRHPIHKFCLTALGGRDKWTAYKFTKSLYGSWMPIHFKRLCSAIDDLPTDIHFELSGESNSHPVPSGLSQTMESHEPPA